ncbi:hypothetical protein DBIPINDM_004575 [Mesorhizobium sp. AR02]|uniref:hypothetical protein n=1 Tax=Mesorhizobium sp. AR02 TaxID=2865837 RepID=UPI00215FA648|nr:hypothetical protein [Mesorhizobium sp. AR02]UVK51322.1 hypothetical protein DBIPINDM_004575 [Mesorhizobium sp. AR02]
MTMVRPHRFSKTVRIRHLDSTELKFGVPRRDTVAMQPPDFDAGRAGQLLFPALGLAVQCMDRVVRLVTRKPLPGEPVGEQANKPLINNDYGGPGGRIRTVDFVGFFVGQNQKSPRIVPYAPAAAKQSSLGTTELAGQAADDDPTAEASTGGTC